MQQPIYKYIFSTKKKRPPRQLGINHRQGLETSRPNEANEHAASLPGPGAESTQLASSTEKVSCCTVHWSTYLLFPPNCTGIQSSFCRLAKCSVSIRKLENGLNTGARARAASSDLFARRQDDERGRRPINRSILYPLQRQSSPNQAS